MLGTSLALLFLPPFIEQQRLEFEEMQNMQKKQVTSLCLNEYKGGESQKWIRPLSPHPSLFILDLVWWLMRKIGPKHLDFTSYILPL